MLSGQVTVAQAAEHVAQILATKPYGLTLALLGIELGHVLPPEAATAYYRRRHRDRPLLDRQVQIGFRDLARGALRLLEQQGRAVADADDAIDAQWVRWRLRRSRAVRPLGRRGRSWTKDALETEPAKIATRDDRPLDEQRLDECRRAWETVGHRTALTEAFDLCVNADRALPAWMVPAIIKAVAFWLQRAPVAKRGRPWRSLRRAELDRYQRAADFEQARSIGLTRADAEAFVAEWHGVSPQAVRADHRRVLRDRTTPMIYFFSADDVTYLDRRYDNPHLYCSDCGDGGDGGRRLCAVHADRWQRWRALFVKFAERRDTPDFRDVGRIRL
jgi:hypothetical protein